MIEQPSKPCPFCNHTKLIMLGNTNSSNSIKYKVKCPKCDTCGPGAEWMEDAILKWNGFGEASVSEFETEWW